MLATALWRHGSNRAFHKLEKRLLHAFTAHIARDRGVFRFASDLVDLVDINNPALRLLHVILGALQKLQNDVFNIFAHIARFGQRGRIRHGKRNIQNTRQRLRQQGFTAACRPNQQNVRLGQLDIPALLGVIEAFVMVVHGHREHTLGHRLTNHIVIKHTANFLWRRNPFA